MHRHNVQIQDTEPPVVIIKHQKKSPENVKFTIRQDRAEQITGETTS